jgi:hypothetical protein
MNPYAPLSLSKWLALAATLIRLRRQLRRLQPAFKTVFTQSQMDAIKLLRKNINAKQRIYMRWYPVYQQLN